ncbi:hypothetical protein Pyrde_1185 [Pyrodictium delaneyi]|uniref:Secondary thiamine-phosphate synthase enzyme n=1 Tax=Pyrodictium delaneyi TaxID=1273541 RepID=A0A0N7JD53_9CREN|nr:secondary thiamine-phosphate synthase enzyme YjbQ [Pyrodictium delaneyi]ALL01233.1 hypothetical protein Pyrde_1185 [Pyrodictium delaneyi]OWJ55691.1 hypothetical protein Pdsh_02615 [Pyrodictium delaneyi]
MKIVVKELSVTSTSRFEIIDLTSDVEAIVRESGIKNGLCLVFVPHATAAIMANEAEPGLLGDYIEFIQEVFKPDYDWRHNRIDDNAHAHLAAAVIGPSRVFPILGGRLVKGTWQNILLVELDGPRTRRIIVEIMGD